MIMFESSCGPFDESGESSVILRKCQELSINVLYQFSVKFVLANRKSPEWTPHSVASHLGLYCLPK